MEHLMLYFQFPHAKTQRRKDAKNAEDLQSTLQPWRLGVLA